MKKKERESPAAFTDARIAVVLLPTEVLMVSIKITAAEQCSMYVHIIRNATHMCAFIQGQIFRWEQWQTESFVSSEMRHTNIFQN